MVDLSHKRVLITGADGFIGSHLTEMLVKKGAQVRALSYYNSFNYWGWLEDINCKKDIEVVCGDVRDPFFCHEISKNIDVVFHLAALIAIPYSYVAPDSYVDTNIKGTVNMCKAALDHGVQKFIHTSTSEVYGTARYVPIDEKHPLQPQSPYSASKIAADAMAKSFYNAFKLPLITARPFNTYGPRQSARAIIPTIISQLAAGKESVKIGDLRPTRDFNYVLDTCLGFIKLAESDNSALLGEEINIGSNYEISIKDLFLTINSLMGTKASYEQEQERIRPEKSEVHRLWCDNNKIKQATNFAPQFTLEQGLKETIAWFRNEKNLAKYKTDIYNV